MKLRTVAAALSSAVLVGGVALCSGAYAQDNTNTNTNPPNTMTVIVGGEPDLTYASTGAVPMNGAMGTTSTGTTANQGNTGTTVVRGMGPVSVEGITANWVPQVDEPVVPGVVVSQDLMSDRAVVHTHFGYVAMPTAAGARVLYRDRLVSWLTVPVGQVVQVPVGALIDGPVPHKVEVPIAPMTDYAAMNTRIMSDFRAALAADAAAPPPPPAAPETPAPPATAPATPPATPPAQ